jgi:hypothetical protein
MTSEIRQCQNCKKEFMVYAEDFAFYEKMQVPPPTFCPDCRLERRMTFRNERILYWKTCDAPGHNETILSLFSPDNPQRIYDQAFWWGDSWDPMVYGRNYNFSRNFFEQLRDLWQEVPDVALMNQRGVRSEYCSITEGNKDCYLVIGGDFNENSLYSAFIFNCKECMDCYWISKSEFNYETVDCISSSRLLWSRYCEGCYDSAFLFNCRNCHHCFGCTNLNNKSYCIFNKEYSKDEYEEKVKELMPRGYRSLSKMKERFRSESLKYPRRFAKVIRSVNSSGDDLEGAKNCRRSFSVFGGAEDSSYLWLIYSEVKDCFDCDHSGLNTERVVDSSTVYPGSGIYYSRFVRSCRDTLYSYNCHDSSNLFGCVGLRNKQYCILNKQYEKEEYEKLIPQIRKHMDDMPYMDKGGRKYGYGEFFPSEISPFSYNETVAAELHPLSHDEAMKLGYKWRESSEKQYTVTLRSDDLPDTIAEVKDSILNEVISCAHGGKCNDQCATAFKVTPAELGFYRKFNLPLPHLCSNCRHYERLSQRNPLKLWKGKCQCGGSASVNGVYRNTASHVHGAEHCPNEFETTYSPDRSEIVYCEECYQKEVA